MNSLAIQGSPVASAQTLKSASSLFSLNREYSILRDTHAVALALLVVLFASTLLQAQNVARPAESPAMRQLHEAVGLAEHGDTQAAMAIALHLLERDPKFVPALKLKGMLLEESGRTVEAAAIYESGLTIAPNDGDLLLRTGMYKLMAGKKDEAIKLLEHCSRVLPQDGDAQYYLAQAYHLNGQDDLALKAIRQSLKIEPKNPSVWQKYGELLCTSADCQEGLRWMLKAQKADPKLPRIDYDIGSAEYKMMDIAGAGQALARAVEAHPDDLNALELLAAAQVKLPDWQQAKATYARFLAYKPDDVESMLGLGHCELELKDYRAAIEALNAVLRLDPTRLLAHFYLSRAYAGMGNTAEAQHEAALHHLMTEQAAFVRSAETEERENSIKMQTRELLTQHREEDALRLYPEHFKGTDATRGDSYVFIGKIYLFMGNTEDGLRNLHHALEIEPTVRGAHTYEGILALKSGDLDKAEREFKSELANDPNYQTAIAELGEVRYHQQRWAEAAELLAKSKTMTPELIYMLCDSYFHLGKVQEANLNAETAAAYGRDNPEFIEALIALLKGNQQDELATRLTSSVKP